MIKLLLFLATISILQASPLWYKNHLYKTNGSKYYGYGEGTTKKAAFQNAVNEISNQIKVEVSSKFKIENRTYSDESSSSYSSGSISSNSHATLKNLNIKQSSQEDNKHYVLLEYTYTTPLWFETRSVEAPIFSKVGYGQANTQSEAINMARDDLISQGVKITDKINPVKSEMIDSTYFVAVSYQSVPELQCLNSQNSFLSLSALVKEANKLTNCKYDYQLEYLNNSWYLKYKTISEKLTSRGFSTFFNSVLNKSISISTHKTNFYEGEGFHLIISSKKSGYVSIINVYEDGRVGVVLNNQNIKANSQFVFPTNESGKEFIATLLTPSVATKDMYVALYSKNKIDLSSFEEQNKLPVSDKEYLFDKVLKILNRYEYTTLILRTRPN